jgi:Spy/CpxP family protein refolding chaperone
VNEGLIRSTTQELTEAQTDAAIAQAHVRAEILSILTAEQRSQLTKLQADRQARAEQTRQRVQERRQNQ